MAHKYALVSTLILSSLSLFLPVNQIFSQDILWEKSYGGRHADHLFDAQPTADYGFILAGSSLSKKSGNKTEAAKGNLDYWVWKMDEGGELSWQKSFGGSGSDLLRSVRLTSDGGFILAGTSDSPKGLDKREEGKGANDFWIIKLDAGGGQQWQRTLGGSGNDDVVSVCETADGGFVIGGNSQSEISGDKTSKNQGNLDYWIIRLDHEGRTEWQKTYGGKLADELRSVNPTKDGGYIVGGYSNSPESGDKTDRSYGIGDFWILKLDRKGDISWQKTLGGSKDDQLSVIFEAKDGGYIAGGNSNSGGGYLKTCSPANGTDFWVVRLNEEGNSVWQQSYDFGRVDILTSIVENDDKTLLIGGFAQSEAKAGKSDAKGITDYIALKVSPKGEILWDKVVGSGGDDLLRRLIETRDGGYLLAGTSNPERPRSSIQPNNAPKSPSPVRKKQSKNLAAADRLNEETKKVSDGINDASKQASERLASEVKEARSEVNNAIGEHVDSRFSLGGSDPQASFKTKPGEATTADPLGDMMSGLGQPTLPPSGDKSKGFGGPDFWVVKLLDKEKKKAQAQKIEAMPNPAMEYTNVLVGYEFEKGTASLYNIAGIRLQSFPITERTIPVNLTGLPEGIYIVQIKTNVSTDSVKIIKGIEKQ